VFGAIRISCGPPRYLPFRSCIFHLVDSTEIGVGFQTWEDQKLGADGTFTNSHLMKLDNVPSAHGFFQSAQGQANAVYGIGNPNIHHN